MIKLYLARHGNTFGPGETPYQIGSSTDLDLTERGREQAAELGAYFKSLGLKPKAIFSGDLKRQRQTAEVVAGALGLSEGAILSASGLNEIDYGLWEGKSSEEISSNWAKELADWNEASLIPENIFNSSENTIVDGIRSWVSELKENYKDEDEILAFSSGGLIRYFLSLRASEWRKLRRDRALENFKIKTGHFSELGLHPGEIELISWNRSPV